MLPTSPARGSSLHRLVTSIPGGFENWLDLPDLTWPLLCKLWTDRPPRAVSAGLI